MATVPPEDQLRVASKVKENYSYVCQDIVKEFRKYDAEPYKHFERYEGEHSVTGRVGALFTSVSNLSDKIAEIWGRCWIRALLGA